jgi:thioesterase domain-containing protein
VALEVAQQLVAQGETVRFLGMFENPAPKSGYRRFRPTAQNTGRLLQNLPYWAGDFMALDWKLKWRRLEREVKQRAYHRAMRQELAPDAARVDLNDVLDDVAPVPLRHQRVIRVHIGAMMRYQPRPYAGTVTVFRTRRQPLVCSHDPQLGWGELAARVEVRAVAGSHHNLLEEPYVESLARQLREALDLAARGG